MSKTKVVRAEGRIPYGSRVLVRDHRAAVADDNVANGTAGSRPAWCNGPKRFEDGDSVHVTLDEGLGRRDLHALAAGPINDSNALYLPAGKISMAEYRKRQARLLSGEPT